MADDGELDLNSLSDDELVQQMHDDLYDGLKDEVVEGVNILSHFCYPSGIQQAALFAQAALERCGVRTSCRDVPVPIKTELLDRADWLGTSGHR